jgi:hypothetical protein
MAQSIKHRTTQGSYPQFSGVRFDCDYLTNAIKLLKIPADFNHRSNPEKDERPFC